MIITVVTTLKSGEYKSQIVTEATSIEIALMSAYGEPRVDTAGTIPYTNLANASASFVIGGGPIMAYIRSGMPIEFALDVDVDPEAKGKVAGWSVEMKDRIAAAIAFLKTKPLLQQPDIVHYEA